MSMPSKSQALSRSRSPAGGFTLVELMIAMLLGLIVVGSALAIFTTNKRTYVATESLGRVQENGRVAFELMAREVREASGNACNSKFKLYPTTNVLTTAGTYWWSNMADSIKGYDHSGLPADDLLNPAINIGAGVADRVLGTDAIEVKSSFDTGVTVVSSAGTTITLTTPNHGFAAADIAVACDYTQAAIFQVTSVAGADILHDMLLSNCSPNLGLGACPSVGPHTFGPNSTVSKLRATRWYIGNNARGGRSLYQSTLSGGAPVTQEVTEGMSDMKLQYLLDGSTSYVAASSLGATDWRNVVAVRINLILVGRENVSTSGTVLSRTLSHTVNLRNRTS